MPNNVLFLLVFEEFLHWPQKGKEFKCDDTLLVNKGFQVFCMWLKYIPCYDLCVVSTFSIFHRHKFFTCATASKLFTCELTCKWHFGDFCSWKCEMLHGTTISPRSDFLMFFFRVSFPFLCLWLRVMIPGPWGGGGDRKRYSGTLSVHRRGTWMWDSLKRKEEANLLQVNFHGCTIHLQPDFPSLGSFFIPICLIENNELGRGVMVLELPRLWTRDSRKHLCTLSVLKRGTWMWHSLRRNEKS